MGLALEIIKPGEYPQTTLTAADMQEIAESYDPAVHEAPVVVGHKSNYERAKSGEPAHGWFKRLYVKDGSVWGELDGDLSDELKQARSSGKLRKWSAELYQSLSEAGGKKYLKALAFLGAAAPQVKGLRAVQFNEKHGESIIISQEDKAMAAEPITKADLEAHGESMFNKFKGMFSGKGKVRKFADDDDDDDAKNTGNLGEALDSMSNPELREFLTEIGDNERVQELSAELAQESEETHLAELEADPNYKFRIDTQKKEITGWVDAQIKAGHLTPAAKDAGIVAFCEMLAFSDTDSNDDGTMKFSEKGKPVTPLAFFQEIVEKQMHVPTGEAGDDKGEDTYTGNDGKNNVVTLPIHFAEKDEDGRKVVIENLSFAEHAAKLSREQKITLSEAMAMLARQPKK